MKKYLGENYSTLDGVPNQVIENGSWSGEINKAVLFS
jgi:hypothetical protein